MKHLGNCPIQGCDGHILERENSFGCSNADFVEDLDQGTINNGCRYYIFKEAFNKYGKRKITSSEVKRLFANGEVIVTLKNRRTKAKYEKKAYIDEEYGISIDFESCSEED